MNHNHHHRHSGNSDKHELWKRYESIAAAAAVVTLKRLSAEVTCHAGRFLLQPLEASRLLAAILPLSLIARPFSPAHSHLLSPLW